MEPESSNQIEECAAAIHEMHSRFEGYVEELEKIMADVRMNGNEIAILRVRIEKEAGKPSAADLDAVESEKAIAAAAPHPEES